MDLNKHRRAALLVAVLSLALVYFFPLWRIGLMAPQYPEKLALKIWINKVTGDLQTINTLNHYIGMAKVEPSKIPELASFPAIFGALICLGLAALVINNLQLTRIWCAAVIGFAVFGLYDFYAWEYRYGHELSEDAPMKLEESYEPPLIGTKQILNITATSWPEIGGYGFSVAALISVLLLATSFKKKQVGSSRYEACSSSCC